LAGAAAAGRARYRNPARNGQQANVVTGALVRELDGFVRPADRWAPGLGQSLFLPSYCWHSAPILRREFLRAAAADEEVSQANRLKRRTPITKGIQRVRKRRQICLQFVPPDKCKIVQGPIFPQGWYRFLAARENAR
jgi:hypothetical protein